MMKKIVIYLSLVSSLIFVGCDADSTDGVSEVTNYAVFSLNGDDEILLHQGDEYVEPGANAEVAGTPVDVTTSSQGLYRGGALDTNVPDKYLISYSATNEDGYSASAGRTAIVYSTGNLVTDLSGLYTSTVTRDGTGGPEYTDIEYILIWENADGTFEISDGIGGYYDVGRAYGIGYIAPGAKVTVNGLNDFTFGPNFTVGSFGGVAKMTGMTVDPAAKTIDFTTEWVADPATTYQFAVHLEQVQ